MSDRLALAHAIEDAGIERAKAEGVASAIARFVEGNAATKADVQASETAVRQDLNALRQDFHAGEATIRADLQAFRATVASEIARLDTRIERLDAKVEQVGQRTFNRLGALVAVVAGLLFAALHAWPPH